MNLSSATPGEGTDAPSQQPPPDPVAGRIDVGPGEIERAVRAWEQILRGKKRRPKTVEAYAGTIRAAVSERGWRRLEDLTHDNILGWMTEKQDRGDWTKTASYNRALTAWRSFCKHLRRNRLLAENPLEDEERATVDDDDDGSRAATLEEIRRVLREAWLRQCTDKRAGRGNRALYWMCLAAHGCRYGEPARWRWGRHVVLDDPVPHIRWTKDVQKTRRREREIALAPELAHLLRLHREAMRELARTTPVVVRRATRKRPEQLRRVDPDDPEAFVFPFVPPRHTFRKDRDCAGIPEVDRRGRPFSSHSARKFFSTHLTSVGVPEKMTDFLMRHAGRPEHRYYDPSLAEQAAALAKLPPLWPERLDLGAEAGPDGGQAGAEGAPGRGDPVHNPLKNPGPGPVNLTSCGRVGHSGASHSDAPDPQPTRRSPPAPCAGPLGVAFDRAARPGDSADLPGELTAFLAGPAQVVYTQSCPEMPISAQIRVDRTWLAGLMRLAEQLLREGAARAQDHD